jgi:hypothetical protein
VHTKLALCGSAAWRLMGAEMYDGMSNLQPPSPAIERGIALHNMIRAVSSRVLSTMMLLTPAAPVPEAPTWGTPRVAFGCRPP